MSPIRLCAEPRCPREARRRGRCVEHARDYERERDERRRVARKVYNRKRWDLTRRAQLHRHPLCAVCGAVATDVHHKRDLADGGDPWALEGLESLCHSCHSQETRRRQGEGDRAA
jgi:5-methylcytosine-specific restriction protein A